MGGFVNGYRTGICLGKFDLELMEVRGGRSGREMLVEWICGVVGRVI